MADLNLKPEEVLPKVGELRTVFNSKFKDEIASGAFDSRDVARFNKEDQYAACFLRTMKAKGDVDKALDTVGEAFKFRKEMGVNDLANVTFPEEITGRKAIYYKGVDKDGHPILYINVKENNVPKELLQDLRKYIAFYFEQHHGRNPQQMCVVLFDMTGAGISNMNMDVNKYIISCFQTYFPAYLAYMINYDMPTLLSATWTVISNFVGADQRKKILVLSKKQIKDHIPQEHLWDHMK